MVSRVIGIVPAAGYGTRLGQLPGSKELLEVDGLPVIDYLVDRLEAGGCSEIRVVTRPEKEDVRQYAIRRGLTLVLGHPPDVAASLEAGLEPSEPDDLIASGFPDTLWQPLDGFARLRAAAVAGVDVVLGLFETGEAARADVVARAANGLVDDIFVKPADPPSNVIWGCLVARRHALDGLGRVHEPSDHIRVLARQRRVSAVLLSSTWLDVGTPDGLARARAQSWR